MSDAQPPLGSWRRFYALTCAVAVLYIALLWWLSVAFDPGVSPMERPR